MSTQKLNRLQLYWLTTTVLFFEEEEVEEEEEDEEEEEEEEEEGTQFVAIAVTIFIYRSLHLLINYLRGKKKRNFLIEIIGVQLSKVFFGI